MSPDELFNTATVRTNLYICGRCGRIIPGTEAEHCWYCPKRLCRECWDEHGHCGHPEADEQNRLARLRGDKKDL